MLEEKELDDILRDYCNGIYTQELSEDKIEIDDTLQDENSPSKYIQLFACFLNESYYRGYIISESIISKLMDIIGLDGYQYQIIEKYIDILFNHMNDYKIDEENRPVFREIVLDVDESKSFINEYLTAVKSIDPNSIEEKSTVIPHFRNPESKQKDIITSLYVFNEIEYPIDYIYKRIINRETDSLEELTELSFIIYKYNINAYKDICNKIKSPYTMFFLFGFNDNESLDILVSNITSLYDLVEYVYIIEKYLNKIDENKYPYRFNNDIINNNIRRLIELLTINITIEQTAMLIGPKYEIWRKYCDENYHELNTLLMAVNLYESDPDRFKVVHSYDYIKNIKKYYKGDEYFYYRNTLLNMPFSQVLSFHEFKKIYHELVNNLTENLAIDLLQELFDGYIKLRNSMVDMYLKILYNDIKSLQSKPRYIINNRLNTSIEDIDDYSLLLNNIDIKYNLLNRNGLFNTDWIGSDYDFKSYGIDLFLLDNRIYSGNSEIITGSTFTKVKAIEAINNSFKIASIHLNDKFKPCNKNDALYVAKYAISMNTDAKLELLLILGDDNREYKIASKMKFEPEQRYLIGLHNISDSSFTYADLILDNDRCKSELLYELSIQNKNNITAVEDYIIGLLRENKDAYYTDIKEHATDIIK